MAEMFAVEQKQQPSSGKKDLVTVLGEPGRVGQSSRSAMAWLCQLSSQPQGFHLDWAGTDAAREQHL